jgi:hypothetical protein
MVSRRESCFVISPIGEAGSEDRERSDKVLKYIISPAAKACGYSTIRADQISRPGIITSQIIQHLAQDPLVIADLTGQNANVFYELAVRHMVRKPVVQIIHAREKIPFDVSQLRTIEYDHRDLESAERCREELIRQIRAIQESPANFGLLLEYSKQGIRPEEPSPRQTRERRKLRKSELKPYIEQLSSTDTEIKTEALKQLAGLAFDCEIETDRGLLPRLVPLTNDSSVGVRRATVYLFERLSWRILPSYRARYNKKLLPHIIKVALNDKDNDLRKIALDGLAASGADDGVDVLVKLIASLSEVDYKGIVQDNVWTKLVDNGLGPRLRQELFLEFIKSNSDVRNRISRETANKYLG